MWSLTLTSISIIKEEYLIMDPQSKVWRSQKAYEQSKEGSWPMLITNTHINPKFFLMIRNAQKFQFFSIFYDSEESVVVVNSCLLWVFLLAWSFSIQNIFFCPIYSTTFDLEMFPFHAICYQATNIDQKVYLVWSFCVFLNNPTSHQLSQIQPNSPTMSSNSDAGAPELSSPVMIGSILGFIAISVIAAVAYRYRRRNKEEQKQIQRSNRELNWAGSESGLCLLFHIV